VCLFCGRKLTLLQRLKRIEHCSLEHRNLWEEEQAALFRARLDDNAFQVRRILQKSAGLPEEIRDAPDYPMKPETC
jgi:hypothetical protein